MDNKVYFRVSGKEITEKEVNEFLQQLGQEGMRFNSEEGKLKLAEELLNQELLLLDAKENHLDENEEYKKEVEFAAEQILKQFAMKNLLEKVSVTDEDAKKFYENNPTHFRELFQFDASHILVDNEEKAKELKAKVDNGENFEELAKENSSCPSKEKGGNLGEFQSGQMVPEFETALLDMKNGEVSEPVKTQFGYHIIKLNNKKLVKENSFESYKEDLKTQMKAQKQQEVYLNKIAELKEKFEVEKL